MPDAERVADGQHQVADLELVGIGEGQCREAGALGVLDLQHGKIGLGVIEYQVDRILVPVIGRDADVGGALDDVVVGEDDAGAVDDDARAERLRFLRPAVHERAIAAEKALEERIIEERRGGALADRGSVDIDHRGGHRLYHRRKAQLHFGPRGRYCARFGRDRLGGLCRADHCGWRRRATRNFGVTEHQRGAGGDASESQEQPLFRHRHILGR